MVIGDNFVFIHNPRTGGAFTRKFFSKTFENITSGELNTWHLTVRDIPQSHKNKFTFGNIRNPWDWYISWYHLQKKYKKDSIFWKLFTKDNGSDFKSYMKNVLSDEFMKEHLDYQTHLPGNVRSTETIPLFQYMNHLDIGFFSYRYIYMYFEKANEIFTDPDTNLAFDHHDEFFYLDDVCRCRELAGDIKRVLTSIGISLTTKQKNFLHKKKKIGKTKHGPYQSYYDDELRKLVRYKDRLIIDKYGYVF